MNTGVERLPEKVESILDNYQHDDGSLVSILQDTQSEFGYLGSGKP